ncbi:MAG: extracellular solute-binding protein [Treponema sp.]|jgi:raffinose/stachyose/melibiose transport system substrate-binding protein|nr:extracellular solute-binding protein [Treponema sp.]
MKRIFSLALLCAVLGVPVFAGPRQQGGSGGGSSAGGSAGGQIELRVLNYMDLTVANAATSIAEIWEAFDKANPDIKVIREDLFNEPFHNKVEAYAAAGQLPDVMYAWPSGRSTTLHTQRLLKDLGPLIQKDGLNTKYVPAALDPTAQASGYLGILPLAVTSSHAFYINNEVLRDCGLSPARTYAELKAQVPVLKAKGYETVLIAQASDWVMQSCFFSTLAGRFGGPGWEKKILSGQAKFTDPDFVNALNFVKTLYDDGVITRASLSIEYGSASGLFASNKYAYLIDGDWKIGQFLTDKSTGVALITPERQHNFQITVFPDIEGARINKSTSSILGVGWGINAAIPAGSAKEEAAWRLVKWLAGQAVQTQMLSNGGLTTPSRNDISTAALSLEPLQIAGGNLATQYTTGTVVIDGVFESDVSGAVNLGLQELGLGAKTPQQVAESIQRAFDTWKAKQK